VAVSGKSQSGPAAFAVGFAPYGEAGSFHHFAPTPYTLQIVTCVSLDVKTSQSSNRKHEGQQQSVR
jgi:hypothetical protein